MAGKHRSDPWTSSAASHETLGLGPHVHVVTHLANNISFTDEPRRSVRATKGQHTKSLDLLDQPAEPAKKRSTKKATTKKAVSQQEEISGAEEEEIIRCVCGVTEQDDESDEDWIACETCSAWQHNVCMGVTTEKALLDTLDYYCEQCKPENHKELLDGITRGEKPWEQRRKAHEEAELAAQKAKKGKKGKNKRTSDPKQEPAQNGKVKTTDIAADVKPEKTENLSRSGSTKRKARDDPQEESSKVCVTHPYSSTFSTNMFVLDQSTQSVNASAKV